MTCEIPSQLWQLNGNGLYDLNRRRMSPPLACALHVQQSLVQRVILRAFSCKTAARLSTPPTQDLPANSLLFLDVHVARPMMDGSDY